MYPAPEKYGREYRVQPGAIYIQPKSYRLAKEIFKTSSSTSLSLIERIIHGIEAKKYDANLPRNLTYRRREKSFFWRNPITGSEISLG
ncbi:phage integrase Arm DNA-binding domain-containing protein [Yersinia intermedia]|nr:phage integrase Arm DNA-binding domain-containing protein [Yersinia intermedia]